MRTKIIKLKPLITKKMVTRKMITKRMITKGIMLTAAFLILSIFSIYAVQAFAVGVSPPRASFVLARGGTQETTFQTSTNSESSISFNIMISDSIKNFIRVSPKNGQMQLGKPGEITIYASIPRSVKPGNYSGTINVFATPYESAINGTGSKISTGISVRVDIQVLEEQESLLKSPLFLIGVVFCPAITIILLGIFYLFKIRR